MDKPPSQEERRAKRWPQFKKVCRSLKVFGWPMFFLALLLSPLAIPLFSENAAWESRSVRLSGALLQLAGLLAVAMGLSRSRETFGERGIWKWIRYFGIQLCRVVLPPKLRHYTGGDISINLDGEIKPKFDMGEYRGDRPLEERMSALEEQCRWIRREVCEINNSTVKIKQDIEDKIKDESSEREKSDQKIINQMKEAVIGGIHLEATGTFYIAIGIVLTIFY